MRISRLRDENNLTELVDRLFDLERSTAGRREIATRLADANPHLNLRRGSLTRRLGRGQLLAVPDIPGAVPTRSTRPLTTEAARLLLQRSKDGLTRVSQAADREANDAQTAVGEMTAVTKTPQFQQAVDANPDQQQHVQDLMTAAKDRSARATDRVAATAAAVDEAVTLIEQMLKRLR